VTTANRPYIGICDFPTSIQALALSKMMSAESNPLSQRLLMVGVMISRKTLNGIPSKWTKVWPPKEQLRRIFVQHHRAFNCLHYADFDGEDVFLNLLRASTFGGPNLDALQLDMIWPDINALWDFRDTREDLKIVLQVNSRAMEQLDNDPERVALRIEEYSPAINYVLLDKSMGRGQGMDAQALLPYCRAIRACTPELGLAVAGGLGPDTLHLAEPVVDEFPDVSLDAQGQLRVNGSSLDPIDWGRAVIYLKRAVKMFAGEVRRV